MKKNIIKFSLVFTLCVSALHAAGDASLLKSEVPSRIFVNNRILAQVNGKAISVVDIMKKMDMLFYKQYPEYTSSIVARFQFYQAHWKRVLDDLINKELVLADAAENKLVIGQGEIRQEMETLFGPNIILNLDKVGLTFDEALKMVQDDIILQRMIHLRANSKALKRITPQVIRQGYEEFSKSHQRPEEWVYTVISIRNKDATIGAEAANFAYQLLSENGKPEELAAKIEGTTSFGKATTISISEKFKHEPKDLNPEYKKTLETLQPGNFSHPVVQKSKKDLSQVFRIFVLHEHTEAGALPFSEVANQIRGEMLDVAISEETEAYIKRLHTHYHVNESKYNHMTTDDFAPFLLK